MDALTSLVRFNKKLEGRVIKDNQKSMLNNYNKKAKEYGFEKLSKNASIKEIGQAKKKLSERIGYDILVLAIEGGYTARASVEAKELKKSDDKEISRLAKYAEPLAKAKHETMKKLTKKQSDFLENGNMNIKGFGNEDIITLFEKTKTDKQVKNLIDEIGKQDTKNVFYDKQIETFERVFQKIEIYREDDLELLKKALHEMSFEDMTSETNQLLKSLEIYGSPDNRLGAWDDETELANARLDDTLIRLGLKKGGIRKVNNTLKKYKK